MKKKLQVAVSDEAWNVLANIEKEANEGFVNGTITISDIVDEMILSAKIDVRGLQAKHTNIRKSLRWLAAQKDMDVELAIKNLMELRSKAAKRQQKNNFANEDGLA
jgi:hypothetical protein